MLFDLALLTRQFFDRNALEHVAFGFMYTIPHLCQQSFGHHGRMEPSVTLRQTKEWALEGFENFGNGDIRGFLREDVPSLSASLT